MAGNPFRILGRTNVDILKSGGYKLSALEIEEVLREHSAVAEVAVVGIADEAWGERVVAVKKGRLLDARADVIAAGQRVDLVERGDHREVELVRRRLARTLQGSDARHVRRGQRVPALGVIGGEVARALRRHERAVGVAHRDRQLRLAAVDARILGMRLLPQPAPD